MKLDKIDQIDGEVITPVRKQGFSFDRYVKNLQQIDMNNIGAWPLSVKITMYILIFLLVMVFAYFVLIRGVQEEISSAEAQQENLLNEFRDKNSKLRNLKQYQAQVELMQGQFNQQLEQLPKETEIAGLVEDINTAGVSSGLEFKNIQLQPEIRQEIFIEQPIDISVTGGFHSMGGFVSAIAALPRIVTLHDFKIDAPETKGSEIPKLTMNMKAKTYRYITEQDKEAQDKKEGAKP